MCGSKSTFVGIILLIFASGLLHLESVNLEMKKIVVWQCGGCNSVDGLIWTAMLISKVTPNKTIP